VHQASLNTRQLNIQADRLGDLLDELYARVMPSSRLSTGTLHMTTQCPRCHSSAVITKDFARKVGALIGTVGGTAQGVTAALGGAELGAAIGVVAGPAGVVAGSMAGVILGGLAGAATGCIAGAKLGEVFDERVLDNYGCLNCGLSFSSRHSA
jgi:hypothetical protein